jgi:hypothetical protein
MNVASSKVSIYGQHHREPCAAAVLCDVHIIAVTTRTFQTAFATHQKKRKKYKKKKEAQPLYRYHREMTGGVGVRTV